MQYQEIKKLLIINNKFMSQIDFHSSIIKYIVKTNNCETGIIIAINQPEIKIGDFARNIQIIDELKNNLRVEGIIIKIFYMGVISYR